jgi:serine/threonine protein kinase
MFPRGYKKIAQLGQGSFGVVYSASDPNDQLVAIKRYFGRARTEIPYQILREINIMKMINHPNVIQLREVVSSEGKIDVVMEFGGETLREYYLRHNTAMRVKQLRHVVYQVLAGCHYLHGLNIIHRDLKPANILVLSEGANPVPQIKICDFGLAKKLLPFERCNNSYQICTLHYRPPELFTANTETYSESVDVWSLGCLLYEFVIGQPLFQGKTEMVVLRNILEMIPTTEQDLQSVRLDSIRLDKCNTEKYYKLPLLYDSFSNDETNKAILNEFRRLIYRMLVLNPQGRITLEQALADPFLDPVRDYYSTKTIPERMKKVYSRPKINLSSEARGIYLNYITRVARDYNANPQTIFVAINLFDQYLALHQNKLADHWDYDQLMPIAICCLVLASKYIDIKHMVLNDFASERWPLTLLIGVEKVVVDITDFDFNQLTLLDLYRELITEERVPDPNVSALTIETVDKLLKIIRDYNNLIDKDIEELKELVIWTLLKNL